MSHSERQFEDADATCTSGVGITTTCPVTDACEEVEEETDSNDEDWDLLYDDDICADFEEEKGDFTKKLNAARASKELQLSKRGPIQKISSAPEGPKSIQVHVLKRTSW